MKLVILVLLMISFVSAVDVDFDCPNEIFVDEEFECSLEVFDGSGEYDVKIDLDGERNSVLEVWNDGVWKSGYFYLVEFIEDGDGEDVRLRVSGGGDYEGVLKLRQGDKREFFDIEIEVDDVEKVYVEESVEGEIVLSSEPQDIILLGSNVREEVDEGFVYESKDSKIMNYIPYAFSMFLILIIGILVWERF